jgi:membrane-bound inhibitor of C-type lysozyme
MWPPRGETDIWIDVCLQQAQRNATRLRNEGRKMKTVLLSLAVGWLLIGGLVPISAAQGASTREIKAKYTCNKGEKLTVVFKGSKATVTPKGGKSVTLRQAMAADGFFYTTSRYSLRGRGNNATWSDRRHKPLNCYTRH